MAEQLEVYVGGHQRWRRQDGSRLCLLGIRGLGSWVAWLAHLLASVLRCYGVPMLDLKHCFVAEKVPAKREFMMRQFELPVVVEDAAELSQPRSWNLQTGAPVMLEWPGILEEAFLAKQK